VTALVDFIRSDLGTVLLVGGLVLALGGLAIFGIRVPERTRLSRDLAKLTSELGLTESVARLGYWNRRPNTDLTTWSDGLYKIFGVDPETFQPTLRNVRQFFLKEDLPTVVELTDPEKTDRKGGDAEVRIHCADGAIKDLLIATRFRFSKSGKHIGLFGVVIDITDRKSAERAIAEREEQLQSAIAAMGASVCRRTWGRRTPVRNSKNKGGATRP